MPKISLWSNNKNNDYNFIDRVSGENLRISGVGVLIHKYSGPSSGGDETTISDLLFLENRGRNYEENVYESRCLYVPQDTEYDLSQFGIFLSSDTLRIDFHYNDMMKILGRKLISGDVLEFPNMRDTTLSGASINKFFVVQDSLYSASGYGQDWRPHLWKVRAKQMPASEEYQDIIDKVSDNNTSGGEGEGTGIMPWNWGSSFYLDDNGSLEMGTGCDANTKNSLDLYCKLIEITNGIEEEALKNVKFDPKFFETAHLYVSLDENNYPTISYWAAGDGIPPNGAPLVGFGSSFPEDMSDGSYFLRTDFVPDRLFQKQGSCFIRIEDDLIKVWTAYNKRLDTYIDNTNTTTLSDGSVVREKQALSSIIPDKKGLYNAKLAQMLQAAKENQELSKKQDGAK